MSEQIPNAEPDLSSEERFKQTVEKLRPYVLKLWAAKKKFLIFNGVILVLTLVYLLFIAKPFYTSTITILPDYGSKETTISQLSSLASLAGVNVGTGSPTEVYQNLVMSESVLEPVIFAKYKTDEYPDSVNLIQYFEIEPKSDLSLGLQKRSQFLKELKDFYKDRLTTDLDRLTKILTITVKMPEGQLSAEVANNIALFLDRYIRTKRKSYASEQRKYIEKRLYQVKDSLTDAENTLMNFREQNRVVTQSPSLVLEQTRLSRNVEILNAVYLELSKQLELARIDEVKDTPVLNIKETANNPIIKAGPPRVLILIMVLIFSFIISGVYIMFSSQMKIYYKLAKGIKN